MLSEKRKRRKIETNRAWRARNKDKVAAAKKRFYEAHKEEIKEANRRKYLANRERVLAQVREYYEKNKAHLWEKQQERYEAKREEITAKQRARYAANKPLMHERRRRYQQTHRAEVRALNAKRRAAQRQAVPRWADIAALKEFYVDCPPGYAVDHVYPITSDWVCGLHVVENLQYLTPAENSAKGNRPNPQYHAGYFS